MKESPHTGSMLRKFIKTNRYSQAAWAHRQGVKPLAIARYLKRPTMRIDTLFAVCHALNYNFFKQIADALPAEMPPATQHENEQQLQTLKQENEQLKLQVATLEKALGLVGGR